MPSKTEKPDRISRQAQRGQILRLHLDDGDIRSAIRTDSICWQLKTVREGHDDFVRIGDDVTAGGDQPLSRIDHHAGTAHLYLTLSRSVVCVWADRRAWAVVQ